MYISEFSELAYGTTLFSPPQVQTVHGTDGIAGRHCCCLPSREVSNQICRPCAGTQSCGCAESRRPSHLSLIHWQSSQACFPIVCTSRFGGSVAFYTSVIRPTAAHRRGGGTPLRLQAAPPGGQRAHDLIAGPALEAPTEPSQHTGARPSATDAHFRAL